MTRVLSGLGLLLLVGGICSPVLADTCFEGTRECDRFWITEAGYTPRLNDPWRPGKDPFYFHGEVGQMVNLNPKWALGGTLFFGADDTGSRWALKARARRWLSSRVSVDLGPGVFFSINERYGVKTPGFTGHVGLNLREWVQVVGMVEVIDYQPKPQYPEVKRGTDTGWFFGVKSGGYGGIVGSLVLLGVGVGMVASGD